MFTAEQTSLSPASTRRIVYRTKGHGQGPITRLMSPGDLGELVKPFVFLDHFEFRPDVPMPGPVHPHSGLATHTTMLQGSFIYADSTNKAGLLQAGNVEWMQAGGGVWHGGTVLPGEPVRGFQLWVALPPELELQPASSQYIGETQVPGDGRVRVLLGNYEGQASAITFPAPMTYLHVRLKDGERWVYQPAPSHDVAWLAVSLGNVIAEGTRIGREMAVFEEGNASIELVAHGDAELVLGSAVKHPYPLVTGMYSVHTSEETLNRGEAGIERMVDTMALKPGQKITFETVKALGGHIDHARLAR